MAKQLRHRPNRTSRKRALGRPASGGRKAPAPPVPQVQTATLERKAAAPSLPSPQPKKPGYYEAVAIYETGVLALQRHDYDKAADQFRQVIDRYPQERELHERSLLFLRVCERETARRPAAPQTVQER